MWWSPTLFGSHTGIGFHVGYDVLRGRRKGRPPAFANASHCQQEEGRFQHVLTKATGMQLHWKRGSMSPWAVCRPNLDAGSPVGEKHPFHFRRCNNAVQVSDLAVHFISRVV